jgi:protein-S-isoprenylcysteine O-methyltransferase Ste14
VWEAIVGSFRAVEATRFGGLLLGHVWPAYVFALPLAARTWSLLHMRPAAGSLYAAAVVLQETVTIVFLGLVVVLFAIRQRRLQGEHTTFVPGLIALLGTFILDIVGYLPLSYSRSTEALLASSGVVVVGTLWATWSLATLGRCFGLCPEVRGLVTRGPYRLVRHPVYLGEIVAAVGLVLARPAAMMAFVVLAFAALQYWRTIYEERALSNAFPSEYPAYARRVDRLIPGWRHARSLRSAALPSKQHPEGRQDFSEELSMASTPPVEMKTASGVRGVQPETRPFSDQLSMASTPPVEMKTASGVRGVQPETRPFSDQKQTSPGEIFSSSKA